MESKRSLILQWIEQGAISKDKTTDVLSAAGVLPDGLRWRVFIENLLAWLGGLALAFSMMFFIAYNWEAMGRFAKFALVEASIVLCLGVYWKLDVNKIAAKISLTIAIILLGVLLALYGQTYQTGADPWQLFANWALLMLPWAFVAQFASIWLIWVALLNLSIVLYFQTSSFMFGLFFSDIENVFWILFIFNSFVWVVWELLASRFSWLEERWTIRLIAIVSGFSISYLMLMVIFDHYSSRVPVFFIYLVWAGALYYSYRRIKHDLFMLAGLCLSAIVVITSFFANNLLDQHDSVGGFFFLTLIVIAMAAGAAKWLKNLQKEMML